MLNDKLPNGWEPEMLSKIIAPDGLFSDGDWVESKDQDPNGSIRLLQLADIGDGRFIDKSSRFVNEEKFEKLRCTEVLENDVLIARMPDPLGRACLTPSLKQKSITVVDVAIVRPGSESVSPVWLMHWINSPEIRQLMDLESTGSTRKRIARGKIAEIVLPIPPLPEQKRIADKLDAVLGRVDACRTRLDRVPALLKRFRQSVLAAATSGKLTEEWREDNPGVEPADVLLSRIRESRLALAKTAKEKRFIEEGLDEHNFLIMRRLGSGDELPDSWLACSIGAIATVCNGSTPSRSKSNFWDGDIPWVSSGEVRNNVIESTRERITKSGYENTSVKLLPMGTVLLAMIGEGKTRGQSALLNIAATINQNIAAVVLDHGLVDSKYVWRWFQLQYEATRLRGNGTGPQALNCQRVREIHFILPPLPEQTEIVRRVEALFAFADRIEARLSAAQATVARLTPATLAKAFRGELVPQDPDDEPASALLERIVALTDAAPAKKARTKRGRRS